MPRYVVLGGLKSHLSASLAFLSVLESRGVGQIGYIKAIWSLPIMACIGFNKTLQDIPALPQSLQRIEKRMRKLKNQVTAE
jgi:hypothetical protein